MVKINCTKGSIEQMISQFKDRIDELSDIGIDSSFDYPDDLEALENGEYESHATDPINSGSAVCSEDYIGYSYEDVVDWLSDHDQAYSDCLDFFGVNDLMTEADEEDVLAWISDHDRLYEDFMNHFDGRIDGCDDLDTVESSYYQIMDSSMGDEGSVLSEGDLKNMYNDLHDYDPSVSYYDNFEDWLYDTVNNGYLKTIQ